MNKKIAFVIVCVFMLSMLGTLYFIFSDRGDKDKNEEGNDDASQTKYEKIALKLLDERQADAEEMEEKVPNQSVIYYGKFNDRPALFQKLSNEEGDLQGRLYFLDNSDVEVVEFTELDKPFALFELNNPANRQEITGVVAGSDEIFVSTVTSESSKTAIYEFDLTSNTLMLHKELSDSGAAVVWAAQADHLIYEILACYACDGAYSAPTPIVVYNLVTKSEKKIEGAGNAKFANSKEFTYQLDQKVPGQTVDSYEPGGDELSAQLP